MNKLIPTKTMLMILTAFLTLAGCGGSSNSDNYTGSNPTTPEPSNPTAPPDNTPVNTTLSLCGNSTTVEQLLTKINAVRHEGRYCGTTYYTAVGDLTWNKNLAKAAQDHSTDMANYNYFAHEGLNGSTIGDRAIAAGYNYRYAGENIAGGYHSIDDAMTGWVNSPGHCANIMNANFKEYGMACANNDKSTYKTYWTQEFGARQ